jgi:hypothetical protein
MKRIVHACSFAVGLLAVACLSATGCGERRHEFAVSGTITVEGDPVDTGSITFMPTDGATYTAGGVIENGVYKASVPPGKKIVQIRGMKRIGERQVRDEVSGKTFTTVSHARVTPPEYEAADSPLHADVTKQDEVFDFQLAKKYQKNKP